MSQAATNLEGGYNDSNTFENAAQLSLGANFDLEKIAGWKDTTASLVVTKRDGNALTLERIKDPRSSQLGNAQEIYGRGKIWRLSQAWVKKGFVDNTVQVKFGRMGMSEDFNSSQCEFQNLLLCGGQLGKSIGSIWYNSPVGVWAANVKYQFAPEWTLGVTKVIEQPVKAANIPGEQYSLTQPRSVEMPQIGNQTLTESDMWGATPFDQLMCRINFKSMRYEGLFTAPGTDVSLSFPGSLGGMNWGSIAFDPTHRYMFVNDMRLGLWVQLIKQTPEDIKIQASGGEKVNTGMGAVPMKGTPYKVNKNRFMSALSIPCQKPPFGTMTAIDMKTRQVAWQVPLGTVEDTGPLGIKMGLKAPIGMPTIGGPMATQGGLVFFAATQDYYLRAFDSSTGKELWKSRMPVGSQGTPISYVSPKTGKQYVVVTAGGARQSPDHGDYVIAYSLEK
ncbi:carbohydrate porin [Acinetobacter baumannii]|uniref:carbohydrate porin n=1 Tax=Acinetobacter baumannii TaxID=470 RepID=UPI0020CDF995|nr:carbohydrate porin [Acinetobacter baumannii]